MKTMKAKAMKVMKGKKPTTTWDDIESEGSDSDEPMLRDKNFAAWFHAREASFSPADLADFNINVLTKFVSHVVSYQLNIIYRII